MAEHIFDRRALLGSVLFVGPLATSGCPPLATPFLAILGVIVIGGALRRGAKWRDLLAPESRLNPLPFPRGLRARQRDVVSRSATSSEKGSDICNHNCCQLRRCECSGLAR